MSPARTLKKVQEFSVDHHSSTYPISGVALENAGVDLHIGTSIRINSTPLEVACPPPGHRGKFRKIMCVKL
jgi:hypothetical protein